MNQLSGEVLGAAIEVHCCLGPGFLEGIYEEALAVELAARGVEFTRQEAWAIRYGSAVVGEHRLDLLVSGKLIVELKAVDALSPVHRAQVLSYLKATGCELALLINFNVPRLVDGVERFALTRFKRSEAQL